jgi:hypothetical protein
MLWVCLCSSEQSQAFWSMARGTVGRCSHSTIIVPNRQKVFRCTRCGKAAHKQCDTLAAHDVKPCKSHEEHDYGPTVVYGELESSRIVCAAGGVEKTCVHCGISSHAKCTNNIKGVCQGVAQRRYLCLARGKPTPFCAQSFEWLMVERENVARKCNKPLLSYADDTALGIGILLVHLCSSQRLFKNANQRKRGA